MTHASLCKKTYQNGTWFQASKTGSTHRFAIIAVLFIACAGALRAQNGIQPASIPNGTVGVSYSVQLTDTNVPEGEFMVTWGVTSGQLPPGLSLSSSTTSSVMISGTPTSAGQYSFQVAAEYNDSANQEDTQNYTIDIGGGCTPTLTPASPLPQADENVAYPTVRFSISCGGSYSFLEQPLNPFSPNNPPEPPGLTLSQAGVLSGTPTSAGTFQFIIQVTDQNNNVTSFQYSVTINTLPTVSTSSPLPNGPVGAPYSQQIAATGGVPPYTFSMNNNPPGITITPSGVLSGTPTAAGTFDFNIGVTDSLRGQTSSPFQVTFATAVSQLQVAPQALTFNANLNGAPPPTQAISVVPASGTTPPVTYKLVVDNGQSGTAAPSWISVTPTSGDAPAGLVVGANQGSMATGSYPARIQVIDSNGLVTDVAVTLNVTSVSQQLTVSPAMLNLDARSTTPGTLTAELAVSSTGAGTVNFTTSVVNNSPWITSVTASSASTSQNGPVFVQIQMNTSGLQVGSYHDVIQLSSSAGNIQVPVSLFIAESGPILGLDTTGVLFTAIQGGGSTVTQTVKVLNEGDPSSTVNWTATLAYGSNFLNLVTSSGTATSSAEGNLTLSLAPNATELTPGPYYAIVQVTDPNSHDSPQDISVVLDLEPNTASPAPDLVPGGLLFTSIGGSNAPPSQQVQVNTSSSSAVTFNATAYTADGGTWLAVTPATGNASGQAAGSLSVSVNPTGLAPGIYTGDINVSIGAQLESVNVTLIVQGLSNTPGSFRPHATACTSTQLAITETDLPDNFSIPAGWPATLLVQLDDNCASPITTGSVIASFSNGDQALNLMGDSLGNYSATWQPGTVNANMVITLTATAGSLQPATAKLYGGVASNQTPPPTVAPGGTVNNLNPVAGAPLAPGTIAQVYGTGLASAPMSTGAAPLPTNFNNTFALIGPHQAPLYFLSAGQVNIQIPYELTATQQMPIVLSVNNALTLPLTLNIVPATPGVLSSDDGPTPPSIQNGAHIIAQHSADFSLVTSANPAKPGEYLVMYLVGMGATNPSVASGAPSPSSAPLATVVLEPTVTVGGQASTVAFAGLTPGFVGLYQVNFQVPSSASSGELQVDVTQNGVAANPTLLPVSP